MISSELWTESLRLLSQTYHIDQTVHLRMDVHQRLNHLHLQQSLADLLQIAKDFDYGLTKKGYADAQPIYFCPIDIPFLPKSQAE